MTAIHTIHPMHNTALQPHQARKREPSQYETLLGDSIERAFGAGHWELDALVAALNTSGPMPPNAAQWTTNLYQSEIARLALG